VIAFAAGLCLLYLSGLSQRDLWSSHEARAAQNAQYVLEAGRPVVPHLLDGRIELQKPPVFYWSVAVIAWLRNGRVEAADVRLPSAVAAVATVLCVMFVGRRWQGPVLGLAAGAMLATMLHFLWLGRVGRIDMPLTFACTVALLGYWYAWQSGSNIAAAACYLGLALGMLLKGPIALVLCMAAISGHGVLELITQTLGRHGLDASVGKFPLTSLLWGLIPMSVAILGYFWWVDAQAGGQFGRVFFWYHNVARGLGEAEELEHHPWWFYLVRMALDLFPWSLLLPLALTKQARSLWRENALARFGLAWFVGMTAFLSCMSFKRADYLLPAYPGAALFLGSVAAQSLTTPQGGTRKLMLLVGGGALVMAVAWLVFVHWRLPAVEPQRELRTFATAVRQVVPSPEPVLLFRIEGHQLLYHLGRPVERVIEWENLDVWLAGKERRFVIMAPEEEAVWQKHLEAARLVRVFDNALPDGRNHEQPYVLMTNQPGSLDFSRYEE
jgi:4-amino-4-deoxy-L-arabinose transferase-like glycosyltransferase